MSLSVCGPCRGDWGPLGRGAAEHCWGLGDAPAMPGVTGGRRCECDCNPNVQQPSAPTVSPVVKPAKEARKSTAVRLPESLLIRLDMECDARCVGRNLIVTRAIEFYLDNLPPMRDH
jgi:hypothetical protein